MKAEALRVASRVSFRWPYFGRCPKSLSSLRRSGEKVPKADEGTPPRLLASTPLIRPSATGAPRLSKHGTLGCTFGGTGEGTVLDRIPEATSVFLELSGGPPLAVSRSP